LTATNTEHPPTSTSHWSWGFPYLDDGKYSLQAIARDGAGNVGRSSIVAFTLGDTSTPSDTTAPTATIAAPINGKTYTALSGASGTAADTGGSGLASVKLTLQRTSDGLYYSNGGWAATKTEIAATGTSNWSWGLPNLADGKYSLQAIARDGAGNVGRSSVVSFTIGNSDGTPPTVSITAPVDNGSYTTLLSATGTAADNVGVTAVRVRLQRSSDNLYWNGSAWSATAADVLASGTTNWSFALPNLANGSYSLRATARDAAGNTGASSVTQFVVDVILVDRNAPSIMVVEPKSGGIYFSVPAANGIASDDVRVSEVRCILQRASDGRYWDGRQWVTTWTELLASGTTNWTFTMPSLSRGGYVFWAVARDRAGNQTYSSQVRFVAM
jgi:hypothetical protein